MWQPEGSSDREDGSRDEPNFTPPSTGSFTAFITAFNSVGNVLGTFTENGIYNDNQDNSAIFVGIADTSTDIAKVTFGLTNAPINVADFAINQVSITESTSVPEPSTLVLAAIAAVVGLAYGRE